MAGRRLQLARLMMAMGVHDLVAWNTPASLLVVNYHRIRGGSTSATTNFDDGVFDTDIETFRRQMQWLKATTVVLDEEGLMRVGAEGQPPHGTVFSAVTFDDGYVDCYQYAKPVLDELGIRGIFFIPFEIVASRQLGWWDVAAYLLKKSRRKSLKVNDEVFELGDNFSVSLKRILNLFKLERADRTEGLLKTLSDACEVAPPSRDEQSAELVTWDQVRDLRASGHAIGSHSLSHRVLATLDPSEQESEIVESRRQLQAIVGHGITSFAYPVGGPQHIDHHSVRLARKAGYDLAFTFNTGISSVPIVDRFQIPRESASSLAVLKAKAFLPGVMGIGERRTV